MLNLQPWRRLNDRVLTSPKTGSVDPNGPKHLARTRLPRLFTPHLIFLAHTSLFLRQNIYVVVDELLLAGS